MHLIEITFGRSSIKASGHAVDRTVCAAVSAVTEVIGRYMEKQQWALINTGDGYTLIYDIADGGKSLAKALADFLNELQQEYPQEITVKHAYGSA